MPQELSLDTERMFASPWLLSLQLMTPNLKESSNQAPTHIHLPRRSTFTRHSKLMRATRGTRLDTPEGSLAASMSKLGLGLRDIVPAGQTSNTCCRHQPEPSTNLYIYIHMSQVIGLSKILRDSLDWTHLIGLT